MRSSTEMKRRRAEFVDSCFAGAMLGMMPRNAEYFTGAPENGTEHPFIPSKVDKTICHDCGVPKEDHR